METVWWGEGLPGEVVGLEKLEFVCSFLPPPKMLFQSWGWDAKHPVIGAQGGQEEQPQHCSPQSRDHVGAFWAYEAEKSVGLLAFQNPLHGTRVNKRRFCWIFRIFAIQVAPGERAENAENLSFHMEKLENALTFFAFCGILQENPLKNQDLSFQPNSPGIRRENIKKQRAPGTRKSTPNMTGRRFHRTL